MHSKYVQKLKLRLLFLVVVVVLVFCCFQWIETRKMQWRLNPSLWEKYDSIVQDLSQNHINKCKHISVWFIFLCLTCFRKSICVVQLLSHVWVFVTPSTAVYQASLSFTIYRSLLKLMSVESVMPSNHLIFYCPFLLLPSMFANIRGLVLCVGTSYQVAKISQLQLQHQSFQEVFRVDFF